MKNLMLILAVCCIAALGKCDVVWSFAQVGDLHEMLTGAGATINFGGVRSNQMYALQTFILSKTNDGAINVKGVLSPGDVFEQDTNQYAQTGLDGFSGLSGYTSNNFTLGMLTNWFKTFQSNGLFAIPIPGNHDADQTNSLQLIGNDWPCNTNALLWNSVFPSSFYSNNPGFIGFLNGTDSRQPIIAYTNSGDKFLFINYVWFQTNQINGAIDIYGSYSNQTVQLMNLMASHPTFQIIVQAHAVLGANGTVRNFSHAYNHSGPGYEPIQDGILTCSNLLCFVSGHDQQDWSGHEAFMGKYGNTIDFGAMNMQGSGIYADSTVRFYTFNESKKIVTVSTWDMVSNAWVTNFTTESGYYKPNAPLNQPIDSPSRDLWLTNGLNADGTLGFYIWTWSFPFNSSQKINFFNL